MSTAVVSFVFLVSLLPLVIGFPWVNDYDNVMDFTCPSRQILMYLSSFHDNKYEDRRWEMYCRSANFTSDCVQSNYVNDWEKSMSFSCPDDKVLAGVSSYHENRYEDRRFKFTCCTAADCTLADCYTTDYVNELDGKLTMFVPEGQAIRSVYSYYHTTHKDRRFRFELCTL